MRGVGTLPSYLPSQCVSGWFQTETGRNIGRKQVRRRCTVQSVNAKYAGVPVARSERSAVKTRIDFHLARRGFALLGIQRETARAHSPPSHRTSLCCLSASLHQLRSISTCSVCARVDQAVTDTLLEHAQTLVKVLSQ